jgi:hypothetical protein
MDEEERIKLLDCRSSGELGGVETPGGYQGYEDVERTYNSA